ncbi:MAG: hypothetical protein KDC44_18745 [Phaeodactylibacter sp.]|nr:hypothetical protein [Phaeodactylibacter sp.]
MKGKFYRFAYFVRQKDRTKALNPYQLRDGAAFSEIASLLWGQGLEYGGVLFNKPAQDAAYAGIRYDFLRQQDLVVCCTRPPLHDENYGTKKQVDRSNTPLEQRLFDLLHHYFEVCARERIRLAEPIAQHLPDSYKNRADIKFRQNFNRADPMACSNAAFKELRPYPLQYPWEAPPEGERTAAYFLFHPAIWPKGPGLVLAFGMGGNETLVWNHLIRKRYPFLLEKPGFAIAELSQMQIPTAPVNLDFADAWQSDLLLHLPSASYQQAEKNFGPK